MCMNFIYDRDMDSEETSSFTLLGRTSKTWLENSATKLMPKPTSDSTVYGTEKSITGR